MAGPGRGDEGAPSLDINCVVDALQEQKAMLAQILERLPPARGDQHARFGPRIMDSHEVARSEVVQVELESKSTCGSGGEHAALADGVRAETPPQNPGPLQAIVHNVDDFLKRRRNSAEHRPRNRMSTSIYRVVRTPLFELLFGGLILLNTIVMGLEEQWSGAQVGYTLGFYTFYGSEQMGEDAPIMSADSLFLAAEITFAILFTIEVFLRIAASGFLFFSSPSACFDLAVVVASDMSIIFSSIDLSINIQILRLLRAVKLLRLVKLMRTVEGFDPLHIMMTALGASAWALCWAIVLLVLIQTFVAMIVTHVFRLAYLQESSSLSDDAQLELFAYFGTFSRSMLSLFELSLANWPPICRWLMENLHESFMLFALTFKLIMGIAVVGVINAVFIQETFKVASTDDNIMVRMKMRAANMHKSKMEQLFRCMDADGDKRIQKHEFQHVMKDNHIRTWLSSMDMDPGDADIMFDLLRGDDDLISVEELITGIGRLRGPARSIDMRRLLAKLEEQRGTDANTQFPHLGVAAV